MDSASPEKRGPSGRLWLELGPLLLFFAAYRFWGIFVATGILISASVLAAFLSWKRERRISPMTLYTTIGVLLFGGLTIALRDERFIKIKLTAVYLLLAALLGVGLLRGKLLLRGLLGEALQLTSTGWRILTVRYALFFVFLALLNEVLRRALSTGGWVNFKVFGALGLTLVFTLLQSPLLEKHAVEKAEREG